MLICQNGNKWKCWIQNRVHTIKAQQTFVLMKTFWRYLSSSCSEDVLIKTNMFALALRLQKTSLRRLQKTSSRVLVKTNIFVSAIRLQNVFKTFLRRLAKTSSRHLKDVFKTSSRHLAKTSSRHLHNVFKTF